MRFTTQWPIAAFIVATQLLTCGTSSVSACDTPVYRYAMYRWQAAPYEIYYFYDGDTPEDRAAQHDVLRELPYADRPANIAVLDVNISDDEGFGRLPSSIREQWEASKQSAPGYLIYSPQGGLVWSGPLKVGDLKEIQDSPIRKQLATHLGAGKVGVLLMLAADESGDGVEAADAKAANKKAEAAIQDAVKKVVSGDVPLYSVEKEDATPQSPNDDPSELPSEDVSKGQRAKEPAKNEPAKNEPPKAEEAAQVEWLRVDRNDPSEQWLVRSLLAVEPDLAEPQFQRQPMVFVVYGRGRSLNPFVGKGIRVQNLIGDIEYVSAACSCTVKDQNPGADLLIQHDWEEAAALLAAKFGSEEGNESQLGVGDYFPSLAIPPTGDESEKVSSPTADPQADVVDPIGASTTASDSKPKSAPQVGGQDDPNRRTDSSTVQSETSSMDRSGVELATAQPVEEASTKDDGAAGAARTSLSLVVTTTAIALTLLLGFTFLVLRST